MNELVYLKNNEAVCDSLQVAKKFHKRHSDVIRAIENLMENDSTQNCVQCFKRTAYKDDTGKSNKMYRMNRDGFSILAMGFTGKRAMEWKWAYIKAFNQMESFIKEKTTQTWIETRQGKERHSLQILSKFVHPMYFADITLKCPARILVNPSYSHTRSIVPDGAKHFYGILRHLCSFSSALPNQKRLVSPLADRI